jgi:hypothetical protein
MHLLDEQIEAADMKMGANKAFGTEILHNQSSIRYHRETAYRCEL